MNKRIRKKQEKITAEGVYISLAKLEGRPQTYLTYKRYRKQYRYKHSLLYYTEVILSVHNPSLLPDKFKEKALKEVVYYDAYQPYRLQLNSCYGIALTPDDLYAIQNSIWKHIEKLRDNYMRTYKNQKWFSIPTADGDIVVSLERRTGE